jgi:hypothetical protein
VSLIDLMEKQIIDLEKSNTKFLESNS